MAYASAVSGANYGPYARTDSANGAAVYARGFRVIDLGVDVPVERFVTAVREHRPDILALSALLTTTAFNQGEVIRALEAAGLRSGIKVIVGDELVTPRFAAEMGADGYAPTAREAVELAWRLIHG
jgi:5-methyltetrahydrofolate--homocysteine methyltransferase